MKYTQFFLTILTLLIFTTCADSDLETELNCDDSNIVELDCSKLTTLEEAQALIAEVNNNSITDSLIISDNLIGEWGLIGVIPGWVAFEPERECIKLYVTADSIQIENLDTGEISTTWWELVPYPTLNPVGYFLNSNANQWESKVGMSKYSNDFMFGFGLTDDADTYIYEKLSD